MNYDQEEWITDHDKKCCEIIIINKYHSTKFYTNKKIYWMKDEY